MMIKNLNKKFNQNHQMQKTKIKNFTNRLENLTKLYKDREIFVRLEANMDFYYSFYLSINTY